MLFKKKKKEKIHNIKGSLEIIIAKRSDREKGSIRGCSNCLIDCFVQVSLKSYFIGKQIAIAI